jgi:hypothetical protein
MWRHRFGEAGNHPVGILTPEMWTTKAQDHVAANQVRAQRNTGYFSSARHLSIKSLRNHFCAPYVVANRVDEAIAQHD